MSRVYDNWERVVAAVLKREDFRRLALCESFSSSISADFSSRFSFDSSIEDVPLESGNSEKKFDPAAPSSQSIFSSHKVMAIEFEEIRKATKNFRIITLFSEGGFGPVCKGWIHEHSLTATTPGSGIAVAVKMLREDAVQGHQEWSNEINYWSELHHPNLVKLIGYCFKEDLWILVYEFMPKGSLKNYLFGGPRLSLSWATRIKVATDTARGLSFLHDLAVPVIHPGFHCGDILLDGEYNAKLYNFGPARDGPTGDLSHLSAVVLETHGYVPPEDEATGFVTRYCCQTGDLTTKCDVYGFGVVLLELLSGRQAINRNRPMLQENLVEWAKPYLGDKRKLSQIMDWNLKSEYLPNEAYKLASLALQCLSSEPEKRPRMAEVIAALERLSSPNVT